MKKILAILVILTMFVGFAFADDGGDATPSIKPTVTAWAKLTWGVDLGSGADKKTTAKLKHGFENRFYVNFALPLYSGDLSKKGDGNVSVQFTLNGSGALKAKTETANSGTTSKNVDTSGKIEKWAAQLNFFGAYMTVYSEPSFATSYAKQWKSVTGATAKDGAKASLTGYGTKLGYANDNIADSNFGLDVGLKFASNGSWTAEGTPAIASGYVLAKFVDPTSVSADEAGDYLEPNGDFILDGDGNPQPVYAKVAIAAGANVATRELYKPGEATPAKPPLASRYAMGFDLDFNYDKYVYFNSSVDFSFDPANDYNNQTTTPGMNKKKNYLAFGFKVGTKAMDGLDVSIATDMVTHVPGANGVKEAMAVDLAFNAKYKWVWLGVFYGNDASKFTATNKKGKTVGDLAVGLSFASADSGDTNFVEGLGFGVKLSFNSLLGYLTDAQKKVGITVPMGMKIWASYKATVTDSVWVKPYFSLWGETNNRSYADKTTPANKKAYFGIAYELGLTVSPTENVEIDAKWKQGKTAKAYGGFGAISAPAQHKAHNGTFTLALKLIY